MQCKDIPTLPILKFLLSHYPNWCNRYFKDDRDVVLHAIPKNVPERLAFVKMKNLIIKGYIEGCYCGCRGDYVIKDKGRKYIEDHS
jgi:hypothetical protein